MPLRTPTRTWTSNCRGASPLPTAAVALPIHRSTGWCKTTWRPFSRGVGTSGGRRVPPHAARELRRFARPIPGTRLLPWGACAKIRSRRIFLECGILAHGFARARCDACGHDFLIALSCKGRAVCPSCNTRRMAETAAHLADHVLPRVPVRQGRCCPYPSGYAFRGAHRPHPRCHRRPWLHRRRRGAGRGRAHSGRPHPPQASATGPPDAGVRGREPVELPTRFAIESALAPVVQLDRALASGARSRVRIGAGATIPRRLWERSVIAIAAASRSHKASRSYRGAARRSCRAPELEHLQLLDVARRRVVP